MLKQKEISNASLFNRKEMQGQGTIEYLVIIAIVVVIALVVVGLLLQIMGQGSAIPEQTARTAWMSATPFSVVDWALDASDDKITVVLKNNTYNSIDLTAVVIAGDQNVDGPITVAPGAEITRVIDLDGAYTSGDKYSFAKDSNTYIQYDTANITGNKQFAPADIIGTAN